MGRSTHRCCAKDGHLFSSVNPFLYTPLCSSADSYSVSATLSSPGSSASPVDYSEYTQQFLAIIHTSTGLCFHLCSFAVGFHHNLRGSLKYLLLLRLGSSQACTAPMTRTSPTIVPLSYFAPENRLLLCLCSLALALKSAWKLAQFKECASEHFLSSGELPSHRYSHPSCFTSTPSFTALAIVGNRRGLFVSVLLFSPLKPLEQGLGLMSCLRHLKQHLLSSRFSYLFE